MLNDLFKVIRSANHSSAQQLLDIIRNDATPEEIRIYIDETLAKLQGGENDTATKDTTNKLKDIRRMVNLQGPSPSFRRKVMDVHFLCDTPPMRVPAKPWTTVTDDDEIVSHLVSLYFTWDYPFYAFLDSEVFVKHMAIGDIHSEFCTPFLVNALLANACVCFFLSFFFFGHQSLDVVKADIDMDSIIRNFLKRMQFLATS